jgi:cobalt-zinc-cadmium efflux system membrane fusion protein
MLHEKMGTVLSHRHQGFVVAGLAAVALATAMLMLAGSRSLSQPSTDSVAHFVPNDQQLRSFAVQTVALRAFRTQIVTDGYVAAGTGKTRGGPVLPAQAGDMLQAENDLATARVQYRNAAAAEDRQHKLYQIQGAALKDWQQAQADLATAGAALASARNHLRLLGKSDDDAGGTVTLGDNSTVWLIANVREDDAGLVHVGDPLSANLAAWPGRNLTGTVGFISSVIDPTTHRLVIGARVKNPDGLLKPNMLATLTIEGGTANTAPAVPVNGIIYDGDQAHVWVVGPGRKLAPRTVTLGRTNDGFVEIKAGLKAGERVATAGGLFIDQAANGD